MVKWTEELIKSLSSEDYLKYREEIKIFYRNQIPHKNPKVELLKNVKIQKQSILTREENKANQYYWETRKNWRIYNIYKDCPWKKHYKNAKSRCECLSNISYIDYGFLGIECQITEYEVKYLWFRDKAWKMQDPTIDRKDSLYHYTYNNCQFLERVDNSKKARKDSRVSNRRKKLDPSGDWTQLI